MSTQSENCYSALRPLTPIERIGRFLFPSKHIPFDAIEFPKDVNPNDGDVVHVDLTVKLSFVDRIRILFSGRLFTEVRIVTREHVNTHQTLAESYVKPPEFAEIK